MKKNHLKNLALLGIAGAVCTSGGLSAETTDKKISLSEDAKLNDGNVGFHLYTEKELLQELNPEGIETYNSLTPEGKELAREVASQRCNNQNECKGLNGCETEHNSCVGKGSCKGQGKCAIADKNLAVKIVAKKMAEKRGAADNP